ncbi:MAG TPA: penicillin-binding transpeptidase domain-containing protein, partial [Thermoanaerobaculia bacterium]|nr:penicillin-binding transpeptidase domain-containing protein [Thermoanaerobaculia bacterium]
FMARDPARDPRQDFWSPAWDEDQDLPKALRRSTVWYFQELARRVGIEEMQRQVDRLDYGNGDLSAGVDRFWLGESLLLSADEQVRFLRRLHAGEFGFPAEHVALLREGLRQEDHPTVYAKTGACPIGGTDEWVGWWVGWVERPDGPAFFALNLTGDGYEEIAAPRLPLAKAVLAEMGLLPAGG